VETLASVNGAVVRGACRRAEMQGRGGWEGWLWIRSFDVGVVFEDDGVGGGVDRERAWSGVW